MKASSISIALILAMLAGFGPAFGDDSPPVPKAQQRILRRADAPRTLDGLLAQSGGSMANVMLLWPTLSNSSFNGTTTITATGANALALTGSPAASATSSLVQMGTAIAAGVVGGTFLGANTAGVFDFVEFEKNSVAVFNVSNAGLVTATGTGFSTNGTYNKVTITPPASAATLTIANNKSLTVNNIMTLAGTDSQTYTFPAATDTVAALGTIQSFTAAQTFTSTAGVSATGGYSSSVLTATQPVADTIQHTQVSLSSANILGMAAAPVAIIAAPASGKSIIVISMQFKMTRTGTAYANGGVVLLQYGNAATGAGVTAQASTIAATVVTGAAGTTRTWRLGSAVTPVSDQATANFDALGIFISNQTAAFITGTGTAVVDVWYMVI